MAHCQIKKFIFLLGSSVKPITTCWPYGFADGKNIVWLELSIFQATLFRTICTGATEYDTTTRSFWSGDSVEAMEEVWTKYCNTIQATVHGRSSRGSWRGPAVDTLRFSSTGLSSRHVREKCVQYSKILFSYQKLSYKVIFILSGVILCSVRAVWYSALKHKTGILRQWSNPVSGSRKSQARSSRAKQHRV